jgi:PAS domain S-box-containing protein
MGQPADRGREESVAQLEARLAESVRRLEETQALARVGSWEWDLSEWRATWSKEMLRIFGRDPAGPPPTLDELIASVHPDDQPGFRELVARIRETPGPFRYSYRIIDAEGEVRHLQAFGRTAVDVGGKPTRAYGTTQDISELKRSEAKLKQAQRLEAVGQLASGVAHDFNNLLAVILNRAECLIEDGAEANFEAGLREIRQAALTAADLTRHLLLFSRHEATELQPVDLGVAVGDAESLLRSAAGERFELDFEVEPGLAPVRLGSGQAEQILVNLVVNARDAMPEGGRIAISVRAGENAAGEKDARAGEQDGSHLVLAVADEGVGMTAETIAKAFDPFFTTKPRDRGTGLGLATVYGIVSQAGGRCEIESEPGRGAVVSVHFPTLIAGEEGALAPKAPSPPAPRGEKVLVVDDEEAVRTIVCHMLERHGYRTVAAGGGAEAEAVLAEEDGIDLLLTDVVMPGMSGWELVGQVHSRNPGLRAIYMSGNVMASGSPARPLGESAMILEKPFTGIQLVAAVSELLARGRGASADSEARE